MQSRRGYRTRDPAVKVGLVQLTTLNQPAGLAGS
jgi:hypothetical protein